MGTDVGSEVFLDARYKLALYTMAHQEVFVVLSARRPQVQNGDVLEAMSLENVALHDGRCHAAEVTMSASEFCCIAAAAIRSILNHIGFIISI